MLAPGRSLSSKLPLEGTDEASHVTNPNSPQPLQTHGVPHPSGQGMHEGEERPTLPQTRELGPKDLGRGIGGDKGLLLPAEIRPRPWGSGRAWPEGGTRSWVTSAALPVDLHGSAAAQSPG